MPNIFVTGNGTDVGKTLISAILMEAFEADYWKPIQCGPTKDSDLATMQRLVSQTKGKFYPCAYEFKDCVSPDEAARRANVLIENKDFILPVSQRPIIIETCGGVMVPLNKKTLLIDLFSSWKGSWVVVSRHYIGSINHTLLTIDLLKRYHMDIRGVIFNGEENQGTEESILHFSGLPFLGRLLPEKNLSQQTIRSYALQWKQQLFSIL